MNYNKRLLLISFLQVLGIAIVIWIFTKGPSSPLFQPTPKLKAITPPPSDRGADERATIEIFEMASPSVVFITNKKLRQSFFSFQIMEIPQGSGSGFIWDARGHIVTNFHVIYQANEVEVTFQDGSTADARLVGADPDHDLAVLKVNTSHSLQTVLIGDSSNLKVGQKVLAIGNPFGLNSTLTTGIISALGRSIKSMTNRTIHDVIQTDAAINPGNSGGPLLDSFGRLIGVNTAIVSPSGSSAGIGFAVPVDTVNYVVSRLISHGKIDRPGLGVTLLPQYIANRLNIEGAIIFRVSPGSVAERSDLRGTEEIDGEIILGDTVIDVEGEKIQQNEDLISALDRFKVGDEISIKVLRDNSVVEMTVRLQALE